MKKEKNYQGNPIQYGFVYHPGEFRELIHGVKYRHPSITIVSYSWYRGDGDEQKYYQLHDGSILDLVWQCDSNRPNRLYAGNVERVEFNKLKELQPLLNALGGTYGRLKSVLRLFKKLKIERVLFCDRAGSRSPVFVPWKERKNPISWVTEQEIRLTHKKVA